MALTMSYVVMNMISGNSELLPMKDNMVWALALGLDIGGNMTPIGASANVVAYRVLEKTGIKVGWLKWMKHAIPVTVLALAISTLGIYLKITI
jgi:Na+/H+ antiporter NhaD/arsenite permease-like protein